MIWPKNPLFGGFFYPRSFQWASVQSVSGEGPVARNEREGRKAGSYPFGGVKFSYWLKPNQVFSPSCPSKCFTDERELGASMAVLNLEAYNPCFLYFFFFSTCCALKQRFSVITVY